MISKTKSFVGTAFASESRFYEGQRVRVIGGSARVSSFDFKRVGEIYNMTVGKKPFVKFKNPKGDPPHFITDDYQILEHTCDSWDNQQKPVGLFFSLDESLARVGSSTSESSEMGRENQLVPNVQNFIFPICTQ